MWTLLLPVMALLALQDTTAADSTIVGELPQSWWAIGILGLWQVAAPVIASWLFKQWTALQARLSGFLKAAVYVLLSTLALQLPKWIGYALDSDPNNWTPAVVLDLLTSVGATLLYRFGTRPDSAAPKVSASRARRVNGGTRASSPPPPPPAPFST